MNAREYQNQLKDLLSNYFEDVDDERSIFRDAEDLFIRDPERYSPRLDMVIGPYNLKAHEEWRDKDSIKDELFEYRNEHTERFFMLLDRLRTNNNPRYAVAIEIAFSGSSKHILGDITNASLMGLYGFVVTNERCYAKAKRIYNYLIKTKQVEKSPPEVFNNVKIIRDNVFLSLF